MEVPKRISFFLFNLEASIFNIEAKLTYEQKECSIIKGQIFNLE